MNTYDFRGLKCPVPVLKAFNIIKKNKQCNLFVFLTNDKSAPKDFKSFCKNTGHVLVNIIKEKDYNKIEIKRTSFEK